MGQKSKYDALLFRFFTKKSLPSCPYFVKNVHYLKKISSHGHILSIEHPFLKKHYAPMLYFQNFSQQTPNCHALISSKNVNSVITILFYGQKKLIRCLFFFLFLREKIAALMLILYRKDVYSLNHTLLSSPYFVKKPPFSQKTVLSCYFFFKFL